jgi:hypothetical protein
MPLELTRLEQMTLLQCWTPTWDGNLASTTARNTLRSLALLRCSSGGYNVLTMAGVERAVQVARSHGLSEPLEASAVGALCLALQRRPRPTA